MKAKSYEDAEKIIPKFHVRKQTHEPKGFLGCYSHHLKNLKAKYSLQQFKDLSETDRYKTPEHRSADELDGLYWQSMREGNHFPLYGDDIDASLFDNNIVEWNLNRLPVLPEFYNKNSPDRSCFKGIFTSYLYLGMWRSSFPMHAEDLNAYSLNLLHFGAEKVWYFVPRKSFSALKKILPDHYKSCPEYLRHKSTIFGIDVMNFRDVPVLKAVQKPGEIIVTFPNGGHQEFNAGFNCAEAVNYCPRQWVKYGISAQRTCSDKCKSSVPNIDIDEVARVHEPSKLELIIFSNLLSFNRTVHLFNSLRIFIQRSIKRGKKTMACIPECGRRMQQQQQ